MAWGLWSDGFVTPPLRHSRQLVDEFEWVDTILNDSVQDTELVFQDIVKNTP